MGLGFVFHVDGFWGRYRFHRHVEVAMSVGRILEIREAETAFFKATQAMITEKINWEFCLEIKEHIEDGLSWAEALRKTIKDHGYHLTGSVEIDPKEPIMVWAGGFEPPKHMQPFYRRSPLTTWVHPHEF